MRQPDRRISLIHVLPARPTGTHCLRPYAPWINIVVRSRILKVQRRVLARLGQAGQHQHRDRTGVCPAFLLSRRHALHTMYSGFGAKEVIGAWGLDFEDAVGEPRLVRGDGVVSGVAEEGAWPGAATAE